MHNKMMKDLIKELGQFSHTKEEVLCICSAEKILGIGKNRLVLLHQDRALKIPWREEGLRDNEIEYLLYRKASRDLRPLLCPTEKLYPDGSSEQQLCHPVSFAELSKQDRSVISRLGRFGISDAAVNMGTIDDNLVCYDYSLLSPNLLRDLLWQEFYGK